MSYDRFSALKLVTVIVDRDNTKKLEDILSEKHLHFHYMFNAIGTASSKILKSFGLSGTDKTVCMCMTHKLMAEPLMVSLADRLSLTKPGSGITFTVPISGVSASVSNMFSEEFERIKERLESRMDTGVAEIKTEADFALVLSIVNAGFSDALMDAAQAVGVRGGTIIHARRSGIEDAVKFFGITLQAEKEVVAILVPLQQKKELMQEITKRCGIKTEAHGIVISVPVDNCLGINFDPEQA